MVGSIMVKQVCRYHGEEVNGFTESSLEIRQTFRQVSRFQVPEQEAVPHGQNGHYERL